ncbi:cytochrome-c peroxidase [Vibrio sp. 10N.261.51.F12]|uniref:cytochrome-c peroxidase n=1 Tax=Vibrio sp. 10N.261.51.F12 TaxID=3229679 RepID=UPI00354C5E5D
MSRQILKWGVILLVGLTFGLYFAINFETPFNINQDTQHSFSKQPSAHESMIIPPIKSVVLTKEGRNEAKLGLQLFLDPNLSSNKKVSCESCHHIFDNGAEDVRVSNGVKGLGSRNSPTVFNIANNTRFFWDGRASNLEAQMDGPIHNPLEMNTNWKSIINYVQSNSTYTDQFDDIFNGEISEKTIKAALVVFMTSLNTPNAPFDRYLNGDKHALDPAAMSGWAKFQALGCVVCHQGTNVGGNLFQRFGHLDSSTLMKEQDLGRYNVTGLEHDKIVFRVASLRNVADTPPYFHDGRAETLEEAIVTMAKLQLGRELGPATIIELSAFLRSLSAPPPPALEELMQ